MRIRGFTLVELIVCIAIIAMLSAVVAPRAYRAVEKAKVVRTIQDLKAIKAASAAFRADVGIWPGSMWGPMDAGNGFPADPLSPAAYGEGFITPPHVGALGTSQQLASAASAIQNWNGPYLEKWSMGQWGMPYMWDYNNWDANQNGLAPEYLCWLDLGQTGSPYLTEPRIPDHARAMLDQAMDGGDGFQHGSITAINSTYYGTALQCIEWEGSN